MPRRPRVEGAGLIHHVTGHSLPGVDAFPDDTAYRGFLSLLAKTTVAFAWHVLTYCLCFRTTITSSSRPTSRISDRECAGSTDCTPRG